MKVSGGLWRCYYLLTRHNVLCRLTGLVGDVTLFLGHLSMKAEETVTDNPVDHILALVKKAGVIRSRDLERGGCIANPDPPPAGEGRDRARRARRRGRAAASVSRCQTTTTSFAGERGDGDLMALAAADPAGTVAGQGGATAGDRVGRPRWRAEQRVARAGLGDVAVVGGAPRLADLGHQAEVGRQLLWTREAVDRADRREKSPSLPRCPHPGS